MSSRWVKRTVAGGAMVAVLLAGLHLYNHSHLAAGDLNAGVAAVLAEARALGEKARPEYQDLALATLPANPRTGGYFRLDEMLDRAVVKQQPGEAVLAGGIIQALEFDDSSAPELKAAQNRLALETRDGVLRVVNDPADYLINAVPLAVPRDDIGDLLIRMKVDKGSYLRLGWSKGLPADGKVWQHKFDVRITDHSGFQTYVINARDVLRRGIGQGQKLEQLYLQPSTVAGATVEIDYIRFLSKAERYAASANGVDYESVGNELRRALFMRPDQTLEFALKLPQQAPRLDLGMGVLLDGRPLRFAVTLTPAGGAMATLQDTSITDSAAWRDARIDLSSWAGQEVRLGLKVSGDPANVAFWSSPLVSSAPQEPFNVIVMIEDAERADYLSVYGYPKPTTPFKERLMAEQGVLFEHAIAQATKTRPSAGAYMTSLHPTATGLWSFSDVLSDRHLTLAELLRAQGYVTASFIQNGNVGRTTGMHQGFDRVITRTHLGNTTEEVFIGERVSQWLEQHRDRNFFLYLHALDPHAPFDPPQPWRDQALAQLPKDGTTPMRWDRDLDPDWSKEPTLEGRRLLYEAEIAHNDAVVEQFFRRLDALGLSQNTLVVMTADHGEYLGERNFFGNRLWTHRPPGFLPGTHVPLMMVYPKRFKEPKRIKDPVQLIDVMPTVLELAGVERGDLLLQGHSLLGLIDGARPDAWRDRVIVSEEPTAMLKDNPCSCGSLYFRDWHLLSSSRTWPGRLLHYPNLQTLLTSSAYRVAEDSRSERLVASSLPDLLLRWRQHAALGELREANMTVWRRLTDGEGSSEMIDPETVEELRGLGYVN